MRRGEIWSVAARGAYTGKPRPAVIVQDDHFDVTASVTICALTTDSTAAPLIRLPVAPDQLNGLDRPSQLMVEAIHPATALTIREDLEVMFVYDNDLHTAAQAHDLNPLTPR